MEVKKMPIDWKLFEKKTEDSFVKLVAGKPKLLELVTVQQTSISVPDNTKSEDKHGNFPTKEIPCLEFVVTKEDGKIVEKTYSVTSKNLAMSVKPVVDKVDQGKPVTIKITQYGTGFDTYYEWCEVQADGKETATISTEEKK